jgi:hypothetical protein
MTGLAVLTAVVLAYALAARRLSELAADLLRMMR